jgi:hypothetical protein
VHRAESCIKQAVRRGSLDRALHTTLTKTEAGRLEDELAGTLGEKS